MVEKVTLDNEMKEDIDLFIYRLYECFKENNFKSYNNLSEIPEYLMSLFETVSIAYMMIDSHLNNRFKLDSDEIIRYEQTYEKGITILEKMLDRKSFLDFLKMCEFESLRESKKASLN